MATTVGTRAIAYVATLHAPLAYVESSSITATLDCRSCEQIVVPFYQVQQAEVSSPPEVSVFRSADGGNTFDTIAQPAFAFSRNVNNADQKSIVLDGGFYAFRFMSGGAGATYTATMGILTCEAVTAYQGVS